ncbi:MAG: hypothetical protein KJ043_19115, partial [Anaerolineae bacterium]|nr:hypothetical protein [Anaerolineae bacterium]
MSKILVFFIGFMLLGFIATHNAHAATFDVCTLPELESAITTANSNGEADVINFNCSTTLTFTIPMSIFNDGGNPLTINANGNAVTFDGNNITRHFVLNSFSSLTLDGLRLEDGAGSSIYAEESTLTITNSTFANNLSSDGGAIYAFDSTLFITNSTFTGNSALSSGGAIYRTGNSATITNSTFTNNTSVFGGAIYHTVGTLTINGGRYDQNGATSQGGNIWNG